MESGPGSRVPDPVELLQAPHEEAVHGVTGVVCGGVVDTDHSQVPCVSHLLFKVLMLFSDLCVILSHKNVRHCHCLGLKIKNCSLISF